MFHKILSKLITFFLLFLHFMCKISETLKFKKIEIISFEKTSPVKLTLKSVSAENDIFMVSFQCYCQYVSHVKFK